MFLGCIPRKTHSKETTSPHGHSPSPPVAQLPTVNEAVWRSVGQGALPLGNSWTGDFSWIPEPCGWRSLVSQWNQEFPQDSTQWIQAKSITGKGCEARVGDGGGKCHPPVLADRHASSQLSRSPRGQWPKRLHYVGLSWSVGENWTRYVESSL